VSEPIVDRLEVVAVEQQQGSWESARHFALSQSCLWHLFETR
jgi:hypothetical protein